MHKNPMFCPICGEFQYLEILGVDFEKNNKHIGMNVPIYRRKNCENRKYLIGEREYYENIAEKHYKDMVEGDIITLKFQFEDVKFEHYEDLEFVYSSEDYYLIPGLYRDWNDGFLTPVFFDKDVLLYYNNHPDYRVELYSFSSGNIYYKGERLFSWGFGINRSGKIFKWLGDLSEDFEDANMKSHLKRFQASNIASDHDIYSKFYLSQIPSSPSEAFQASDNENEVFRLKNIFDKLFEDIYSVKFSKIEIAELSEYYKPPILEEKEQIFSAYLSLNKYLIETIQVNEIKEILIKENVSKKEIEGKKGLKLFQLLLDKVFKISDIDKKISPLFVLYDLRSLHGHISISSFEESYNSCKQRLGLKETVGHYDVYKSLVKELTVFYQTITNEIVNKKS